MHVEPEGEDSVVGQAMRRVAARVVVSFPWPLDVPEPIKGIPCTGVTSSQPQMLGS